MNYRLNKALLVIFVWVFMVGVGIAPSWGQESLVPVQHPVYEWLHHKRILGHVPYFSYEALPLARRQVRESLSVLNAVRQDLSRIDRRLLDAYMREFNVEGPDEGTGPSVFENGPRIWFTDDEPHIYTYRDSQRVATVDLLGGAGAATVEDGDFTSISRFHLFLGMRAYATLYDNIGVHWEWIQNRENNNAVLQQDPLFRQTFQARNSANTSDILQSFVSLRYKTLSAHYGRGNVRYGPSPHDQLLLSSLSAHYDWLRLNIDWKAFRFTFLHGALSGPVRNEPLDYLPGELSRVADPRWFAMHRFEVRPSPRLQFAFSEVVTYSNRGVDPAYLHPFYIIRIAEFARNDQDNPMMMLDAVWRPLDQVELYGVFLLDDIKFDVLFTDEDRTTKYGAQVGGVVSLRSSQDIMVEYTRISPFVYIHQFRLNNYEQEGIGVGHQLGPNGEQTTIAIRQWLPWRGWVKVAYNHVRKGLNVLDENGNLLENVGSDYNESRDQVSQRGGLPVGAGDVQNWGEVTLEAQVEPKRGFAFSLGVRQRQLTKGTRLNDLSTITARLLIGF